MIESALLGDCPAEGIDPVLRSQGWVSVLLFMGGDLSIKEWATRMGAPVSAVRIACRLLGVRPAPMPISASAGIDEGAHATEAPLMEQIDYMDKLNEVLARAEMKLAELQLGVPAEISLVRGTILGFGKVDGEWRLYMRGEKMENRTRLKSASKRHRLAAAGKLGELHARLVEVWHAENGDVKRAIEQAEQAIADISWAQGAEADLTAESSMMELVRRGERLPDPTEEPCETTT